MLTVAFADRVTWALKRDLGRWLAWQDIARMIAKPSEPRRPRTALWMLVRPGWPWSQEGNAS